MIGLSAHHFYFLYISYIEWANQISSLPSLLSGSGEVWCAHGHGNCLYIHCGPRFCPLLEGEGRNEGQEEYIGLSEPNLLFLKDKQQTAERNLDYLSLLFGYSL